MVLRDHGQTKIMPSLRECLLTTKLSRIRTYFEGLLPINLLNSLVTWSCEITWQTKTIISPIQQCLWPPILAGWWDIEGLLPWSHMTLWLRVPTRSLDKLKPLYLHYCSVYGYQVWRNGDFPYHNVYGHQTWQCGDFYVGLPTHKFTRPFDHMVVQDYVTNH